MTITYATGWVFLSGVWFVLLAGSNTNIQRSALQIPNFMNFFPLILRSVSPSLIHNPLHPLLLFVGSLSSLCPSFRNSIAASAVCAFNLSAISQVFNGPFKYQENSRSAWLPYPNPNPDFQVTKPYWRACSVCSLFIWRHQKHQNKTNVMFPPCILLQPGYFSISVVKSCRWSSESSSFPSHFFHYPSDEVPSTQIWHIKVDSLARSSVRGCGAFS